MHVAEAAHGGLFLQERGDGVTDRNGIILVDAVRRKVVHQSLADVFSVGNDCLDVAIRLHSRCVTRGVAVGDA
eukprot:1596504-Prymnesium_polylepis.1